jgi:transposase
MLESRIKELAELDEYKESVQKLRCFIGIDTIIALSLIVEVGDFHRFATAGHFMSYIGLTPGEDSSGQDQNRLGITKAGNRHLRKLLSESSQCFSRGKVGAKSVALKKRQQGNPPAVIEYADKANIRLKKRFYHLVLNKGKHRNVAIIAVSRELAGFIWGMMTEQYA